MITTPEAIEQYKDLLVMNKLGIKISYQIQNEPRGLPEAFILGEKFIDGHQFALSLVIIFIQ